MFVWNDYLFDVYVVRAGWMEIDGCTKRFCGPEESTKAI